MYSILYIYTEQFTENKKCLLGRAFTNDHYNKRIQAYFT